jgi:hypothetical protein
MVAAAVGFGDEGAEFALAAFEMAMLEGVEGVLDLLGHGLSCGEAIVLEGAGEEDVTVLVGCGVEGVGRGRGVGQGLEKGGGREAVVPLGVVSELVGGEGAGGVVFGKDEGA